MRIQFLILVSLTTLIQAQADVKGDVAAPPPLAQRAATAEVVIVGKVLKLEPKTIDAAPRWSTKPVPHTVAVLKIEDKLMGAKNVTHLRVGFINTPGHPRYPEMTMQLTAGQRVMLFLHPHPKESFYIMSAYYDRVAVHPKNAKYFEQQVAQTKTLMKLMENPQAALKSKNENERLLAAAMLIVKYRTPVTQRGTPYKEQAISQAESSLILKALAKADFQNKRMVPELGYQLSPMMLLTRLGITEKDGLKYPKDFRQRPAVIQKWLKENAEKYRIKKYVKGDTK